MHFPPGYTSLPEPVPRNRNCMERYANFDQQVWKHDLINFKQPLWIKRYSASAKRNKFLKRLLRLGHMDFQCAFWQMIYLFISPQKVIRDFLYQKRKCCVAAVLFVHAFFHFGKICFCRNKKSVCPRRPGVPRFTQSDSCGQLAPVRPRHAIERVQLVQIYNLGCMRRLYWDRLYNSFSLLVRFK